MRAIKFRAWHPEDKRMFTPGPAFRLESGGVLSSIPLIDLMQFTGLKDKNGNEIYEGDTI
jgi:hypothetical protein